MKALKSYIAWGALILAVGGYLVRVEVRFSRLETIGRIENRQNLHWSMSMIQYEKLREHHPDLPPWSKHVAEAWKSVAP